MTRRLNLKESNPIYYPGLVVVPAIGDGSCYFHAIVGAFCRSYIVGKIGTTSIDRSQFIRTLRKSLARRLGEPVKKSSKKTVYDSLSRGNLSEFSKAVPDYSLPNLKSDLDSDNHIGSTYHEFISNEFKKDIYIVDAVRKDVYILGGESENMSDFDLLYRGRNSVVLYYTPGHYDTVGIQDHDGSISTYFYPDHPFIELLKKRYIQKMRGK